MITTALPITSGMGGADLNDEESLYQLAQLHGGTIADQADELRNPQTHILSTIGNGFKSAFGGFINTMSYLSEDVAAGMSEDYTAEQAHKVHLRPSDVIFGEKKGIANPNETTMQKVGDYTTRLAADVALDPLTYVTFGLGGAAKNVSLRVISADVAQNAIRTATEEALGKGLTGAAQESYIIQAVRDAGITEKELGGMKTLSETGQQLLDDRLNYIRTGQEATLIKSEAIKLINESGKLNKGIPTLALDDAMAIAKENIANSKLTNSLIKATIDSPLDREFAIKAMGNVLSRNPALQETFLAKGGIRFFGQTLLSAQRIASVMHYLPGMTILDHATAPIREGLGTMFNPNKFAKSNIAFAPEMHATMQKWTDLAIVRRNEALKQIPMMFKELGITRNEADFLTAAIEFNKPPTDSKLLDLWNGIMGFDSKQIPEHIVQAMREINGINKRNLKEAWAAGIRVSQREGYMSHLVKTELDNSKNMFFGGSPSVSLKASKQANVAKFTALRNQDEKLIGIAETLHLKPIYMQEEIKALKESMSVMIERTGIKVEDFHNQIADMTGKIEEMYTKGMTDKFVQMLSKNVSEKQAINYKAAIDFIKENMPKLNVDKMKQLRAQAVEDAANAEKDLVSRTPQEAIAALRKAAKKASENTQDYAEAINKGLFDFDPEELDKHIESTGNVELDKGLQETLKTMKSQYIELQKNNIGKLIDKDEMARFMQGFTDHFIENPTGVRKLLDGIMGRESKIHEVLKEAELLKEKQVAKIAELENLGFAPGYYKNERGEIFRRERATIAEAESKGFKFETNSLAIMLHSSMNTVKATAMKNMIDDFAAYCGKPLSQAPEGWREVAVSGAKEEKVNLSKFLTSKKGEPIVFHPEVAKQIENFNKTVINDEELSNILKSFDSLTNMFKASVTSIFPAFHGRNAISNVFQNYLDLGIAAINPANHVMSARILADGNKMDKLKIAMQAGNKDAAREFSDLVAKEIFTDRIGKTWTMGELQRIIKDYRVGFSDSFSGKMDIIAKTQRETIDNASAHIFGEDIPTTVTGKTKDLGKRAVTQTFEGGRRIGNAIEDQARILNFVENLRKTGDVQMSASRTKMFLFDYGNLTPFEKTVVKRLVPFYTWMKKNMELQFNTLITTPGRISHEITAVNTLSNGKLTDEEYQKLPPYMRSSYRVVTSRDGKKIYTLGGFGTPLEAAFSNLNPDQVLSATNPFIRLPIELMTGYDTFRGGLIDGHNNAKLLRDAPQIVKDMAGYTRYQYQDKSGKWHTQEVALNPKMWHLMSNFPLGSRLFNETYKYSTIQNEYLGNKIPLTNAVNQVLTGTDYKTFDIEQMDDQARRERVKAYQQMLENAGVIYKFGGESKSKTYKKID